jgi:hypothetical protein
MQDMKRGGWDALLLFLPLVLVAQPAQADVVTTSENGFVVRVAAMVTAKPAEAWRTMISPAQWWSSQHTFSGDAANLTLDPVVGGCFCETLPRPADAPAAQRGGGVQHLRVVYAEPPRALRLVGALGPLQSEALTATMTMTIKPTDAGSRILFEYVVGGFMRYKVEEIAPAVDRMLTAQMASLAGKLGPVEEVSTPAPEPDAAPAPTTTAGPSSGAEGADGELPPAPSGAKAMGPLSGVEDYRLPPARSATLAPAERASRPIPQTVAQTVSKPLVAPALVPKAAAKPAPAMASAATKTAATKTAATKAAASKPAARLAPSPAIKTAANPATKPGAKPATKPGAKPGPKAPNPDDAAHRDANAAFDALLGADPAP